ncbi:hypothetical protein CVT25_007470 [Psilocybe cyanescens]|uniref:G10 protein n=1 Tax=Psilocybe cyanescens TaxID=93625 RepID=A0A409XVQ1_PSICY|nr:hypothetical protein CVT25_007470 [Psilocybe cyanescens]
MSTRLNGLDGAGENYVIHRAQLGSMPKIRTTRTKAPPEGYEDIEEILEDYAKKMRDAENESHEGKRKAESLWPIMRISHARSRYVYELYYKREAISRELYDWLLKEGYADAKRLMLIVERCHSLVAKWKKTGYEKLCCLRCIQTRSPLHLIIRLVGRICLDQPQNYLPGRTKSL